MLADIGFFDLLLGWFCLILVPNGVPEEFSCLNLEANFFKGSEVFLEVTLIDFFCLQKCVDSAETHPKVQELTDGPRQIDNCVKETPHQSETHRESCQRYVLRCIVDHEENQGHLGNTVVQEYEEQFKTAKDN